MDRTKINFYKYSFVIIIFLLNTCLVFAGINGVNDQMVDIGTHKLRAVTAGEKFLGTGCPVVVLEAGAFQSLETWRHVFHEIARFAPVVAYDRAGIGHSEISPESATMNNRVKDLHGLLKKLRILPPYVMVGHSMGSWINRKFTVLYPKEVVGLVYVDPGDYTRTYQEELIAFTKIGAGKEALEEYRQGTRDYLKVMSKGYKKELVEAIRQIESSNAEYQNMPPVPDLPFALLLSNQYGASSKNYKTFDKHAYARVEKREHINKLSYWPRLVSEGTLIITPNSGHFIQVDEPDLVIMAIKRVCFPDVKKRLAKILKKGTGQDLIGQYKVLRGFYPKNRFKKDVLIGLGYEFLAKKQYQDGIVVFTFYTGENPGDYNGFDSLAEAYYQQGNTRLAKKYYQKSLKINPKNTNAVNMLKKINSK